jgi:mitogen-activated protein kinase kinase kinase
MIGATGVSSSPKTAEDVPTPLYSNADSRLSDSELLQYCHDPTIPERERLILTKRNSTPGGAELRRAQAIAKEQQQAAHDKAMLERKDKSPDGQLGRTKTNKLESLLGERPTSFQRPPNTSPTSTTSSPDPNRPNTKRLRKFFGQRPPSELISSNLAEYFPDHEKNILEETVRNSIRRSTRMSHGGRRFSTATTASTASSFRDMDVPPLPPMGEAWLQNNKTMTGTVVTTTSNTPGTGTATPPRLSIPRSQTRPLSMRRALSTASYANSIVESLAEEDDDENDDDGSNNWAVIAGDTIRPDALKPDIAPETPQVEPTDEEELSEQEDSEEEYEEGEFDAVGGGPTRWIRGALIGQGSFGSVYLGMNRTSGELMAVKQVELPSHDVQGEQRKQSMLIALQREIALLRDLTHENIVHYIGIPNNKNI